MQQAEYLLVFMILFLRTFTPFSSATQAYVPVYTFAQYDTSIVSHEHVLVQGTTFGACGVSSRGNRNRTLSHKNLDCFSLDKHGYNG